MSNKNFKNILLFAFLILSFTGKAHCSQDQGVSREGERTYESKKNWPSEFRNAGEGVGNFYGSKSSKEFRIAKQKKMAAVLLCIFLGYLGAHRFYVGKFGTGILQLLTGGGFGIWMTIDFILILCDEFENSEGEKVVA